MALLKKGGWLRRSPAYPASPPVPVRLFQPLNSKDSARIAAGLNQFHPILTGARSRDVNEAYTAVIITDMMSEIFGYDRYSEIPSGTYRDRAIKLDGEIALIELKAIGIELKDNHVKQALTGRRLRYPHERNQIAHPFQDHRHENFGGRRSVWPRISNFMLRLESRPQLHHVNQHPKDHIHMTSTKI